MSVYFAKVGPYIKIGFSENPERRVRRLFSSATHGPLGTPRDLASRHLIRSIDGDKSTERGIHIALADFCVQTEWFLDEPGVRDFIATAEHAGREPAKIVRPTGAYCQPLELSAAAQADADRILARALARHRRLADAP